MLKYPFCGMPVAMLRNLNFDLFCNLIVCIAHFFFSLASTVITKKYLLKFNFCTAFKLHICRSGCLTAEIITIRLHSMT